GKIIIVGSGGHGAELDEYIRYGNRSGEAEQLDIIGFLDDDPENYERYQLSADLLGDVENHKVRRDCKYLIGIANLDYRRRIVESFQKEGAEFITYIHPESFVSESASI